MIKDRIVEKEKAENISKSLNRKYFEISARLGINLREVVYSMLREILKIKNFDPMNIKIDSDIDTKKNTGGSCCLGKNGNEKRKSKKEKNKK